ncbi:YggT family protein [Paenibacillus dokdonensis]|uniref:YggT family protein n=1 Tax=Paenibacillus dokdonensis TaxID=2567944 RepID=UPI0010A9362B|nr:YggT family protein [Paenibacillus dokdonensis]
MLAEIETILRLLFNIYFYMVIVYVLMSWLPNLRENFIGELLAKLVEPYLSPFRRFIPPIFGMLDISPIVALFILQFAEEGLIAILRLLW